jgi:hypothetical protein
VGTFVGTPSKKLRITKLQERRISPQVKALIAELEVKRMKPSPEIERAEDLSFVAPEIEATACLRVARANGGIVSMRTLIQVSDAEKRELYRLAVSGALSPLLVSRAISYREQVLVVFDELVRKECAPTCAELEAKP